MKIFIIRNLECNTQFSQCPASIQSQFSNLSGRSLLSPLPQFKIVLSIESISLVRRFPNTLLINVKLRTPIGVISPVSVPTKLYLVDSDGTILGIAPDSDLPVLYYDGSDPPVKLNSQQLISMQILNQIVHLTTSRISGRLNQKQLVVTITNGPQVFLDTETSPSDWYPSLQLIFERSKISLKSPQIIDLRFTNPVLTY